nr:gliding motility-associated protein GldE [Chryseolinea lacunae]
MILSAIISACEAAFFSLTTEELDAFRESTDKRERDVATLMSKPRVVLVTILILDGFVNVCMITFSALQWWILNDAYNPSVWKVFVTILSAAAIIAIVGEILPKMIAVPHNKAIARRAIASWKVLTNLFTPVHMPMRRLNQFVERLFDPKKMRSLSSELQEAIELASADDATPEGEKEILRGIVNFGTLTAREIMRPRSEISAVDISLDFHMLMDHVEKSGFSRIPVYRGSLDRVEGILYIKDLLPFLEMGADYGWQSLLRPGYVVAEGKKIDQLLKDFQEKRVHIAVVQSEQGHTTGLITLEDIIEEIIGDINDEFDEVTSPFQRIDARTYIFEGKTSLADFCKTMEVSPAVFNSRPGKRESLGEFILTLGKEEPKPGDQLSFEHLTFVIESIDHNRIKRVRVNVHEQA